jgi:hypothetical protein
LAIPLFVSPNHKPKKRMRTSSCKAKGRRLQDLIRDSLRKIAIEFGLDPTDIKSTIMGISGPDITFSSAAAKIFNLNVEAKNVEKLSVMSVFYKHYEKYAAQPTLKILVHKQNHTQPLITLRFEDFLPIYRKALLSGAVPGHARGEHDVT